MTRINFELNITLRCNLACPNCNRHCHLKPKWAEDSDMTVEQIEQFIWDLHKGPVKAKRVKVAGGEPFIHPEFVAIYKALTNAVDHGLIQKIKIDTNGTLPRPDVPDHPAVRWSGRKPSRKAHLPTLWSPTDLRLPVKYPCSMPRKCGISLDHRGYLPCSMAIAAVRTFGLELAYRDEPPLDNSDEFLKVFWPMNVLCEDCVFAGPEAWRKSLCKPLDQITDEEKRPTKTWAEVMG